SSDANGGPAWPSSPSLRPAAPPAVVSSTRMGWALAISPTARSFISSFLPRASRCDFMAIASRVLQHQRFGAAEQGRWTRPLRVAILGVGCTGAVFAIHLARRTPQPLDLHVIEPRATLGAGVAFATDDPVCRLNVPARSMFIFREYRAHFHDWVVG